MEKNNKAHIEYIKVTREMFPEDRLEKCFQLSKLSKDLLLAGLRNSFPDLAEKQLKAKYLTQISRCHNSNY